MIDEFLSNAQIKSVNLINNSIRRVWLDIKCDYIKPGREVIFKNKYLEFSRKFWKLLGG